MSMCRHIWLMNLEFASDYEGLLCQLDLAFITCHLFYEKLYKLATTIADKGACFKKNLQYLGGYREVGSHQVDHKFGHIS